MTIYTKVGSGVGTRSTTGIGNLDWRSAGPGLPDICVQIGFASKPTDASQAWSNVTRYVRSLAIRRGRNDELARVEAGTCDILLDNRDSRFNPENTSSPYYPTVLPKKAVRVLFRSGTTVAPAFYGFTSGFPMSWPHTGHDSIVQLQATDFLGLLARARLSLADRHTAVDATAADATISLNNVAAPIGWPMIYPYTITIDQEDMTVTNEALTVLTVTRGANGTVPAAHPATSAVRTASLRLAGLSGDVISDILAKALWREYSVPAGWLTNVADGLTTVDTGLVGVSDTNPLELIQQVVDSEAGLFFGGRDGTPTYHDRHFRITTTTPAGTFGDAGGSEMPYTDIGVSHDEQQLYNSVAIEVAGGQKLVATDSESARDFWPSTLTRQSLGDSGSAADLAFYELSRFSTPRQRVPLLTVDGHKVPGATLTGFDLDQRYTVIRRPTGSAINKDVFVENVAHTITPAHWVTQLSFSPADREASWWVLGSGALGESTRLAF